jgi:hypothetical protein
MSFEGIFLLWTWKLNQYIPKKLLKAFFFIFESLKQQPGMFVFPSEKTFKLNFTSPSFSRSPLFFLLMFFSLSVWVDSRDVCAEFHSFRGQLGSGEDRRMGGGEASRGTNKLQTNIKILNRCLNFAFFSEQREATEDNNSSLQTWKFICICEGLIWEQRNMNCNKSPFKAWKCVSQQLGQSDGLRGFVDELW